MGLFFEALGPTVISSAIAYFLGRRKTKAEVQELELANIASSIHIYRQLASDLRTEVDALKKIVEELKKENKELKIEISRLKNLTNGRH